MIKENMSGIEQCVAMLCDRKGGNKTINYAQKEGSVHKNGRA